MIFERCQMKGKFERDIFKGKMLGAIVKGEFSALCLSRMNKDKLERIVTKLVMYSSWLRNGKIERPEWWPQEVVFRYPVNLGRNVFCNMWPSVLRDLIARCSRFYGHSKWPPKRGVLAPKDSNVRASEPSKRKVEDATWIPGKRTFLDLEARAPSPRNLPKPKVAPVPDDTRLRSRPFVRLFDISKEIPLQKLEETPVNQHLFMDCLHLQSSNNPTPSRQQLYKSSYSVRIANSHYIPISSDYGRKLLQRENHLLPLDSIQRKMEKLEWFLRTDEIKPTTPKTYECTYEYKDIHCHTYKLPSRQHRTRKRLTLKQALIRSVLKPVSVRLEKMDLNEKLQEIKRRQGEIPIPNCISDTIDPPFNYLGLNHGLLHSTDELDTPDIIEIIEID